MELNLKNYYDKYINQLIMVKFRYKLNENSERINIFGEIFVKNNINKLKILYKGEEYDLEEEFENKNINKEKVIDLELKGFNDK